MSLNNLSGDTIARFAMRCKSCTGGKRCKILTCINRSLLVNKNYEIKGVAIENGKLSCTEYKESRRKKSY